MIRVRNVLSWISLVVLIIAVSSVTVGLARKHHGRRADPPPTPKGPTTPVDFLKNRQFYIRPWVEQLHGVEKKMALPLPKDHWAKKIKHLLKLQQQRQPRK
ncbi:uncharacterized protein LOC125231001 [Leguminivora glycinivorella]|uniref:uncharacterized protein LOC125231001 n=1 Tax=Leguminivora glycinivorella TaxID=1035111 RepID=UPI00200C1AAB|nr:uncharacterized protein LOC125231001 [Leguminivora glycinivorella]